MCVSAIMCVGSQIYIPAALSSYGYSLPCRNFLLCVFVQADSSLFDALWKLGFA